MAEYTPDRSMSLRTPKPPLPPKPGNRPSSMTSNSNLQLLSPASNPLGSASLSILRSTPDLTQTPPSSSQGDQEPVNVLYKVTCLDVTDQKQPKLDRYSFTPFEGFEKSSEEPNRYTLSIMDEVQVVHGYPNHKRASQQRKYVGTGRLEDDNHPFIGGRDFTILGFGLYAIRIWSPEVLKVLRREIKYHPGVQVIEPEDKASFMTEPFRVLAWHWNRLWQICADPEQPGPSQSSSDTQTEDSHIYEAITRKHLRAVLDWMQPFYDKNLAPELRLQKEEGKATWLNLWLMFKPGSTVVSPSNNAFYKVCRVYEYEGPSKPLTITAWNVAFDGVRLRRQLQFFDIRWYRGERNIDKLPICPLEYAGISLDKEKELLQRGQKYYEIICDAPVHLTYRGFIGGGNRVQYAGSVLVDPSRSSKDSRMNLGTEYVEKGTVMSIGPEPDDNDGGELFAKYNNLKISKNMTLEDKELYLLMPTHIAGFALGKKQWTTFEVQSFKAGGLATNPNPLDNVVLDPEHRRLLTGLGSSKSFSFTNPLTTDFVDGKGIGHIIMLHGPPGVGKTLTVECIAQELQRPLLSLTVADMGTNETEVEAKLSAWLDLAQSWNAVVLIDEADMYLGQRQKKRELQRNAMVSTFLHALEYYPGMIFITTNRPGDLDDAFISRFHLILQYQSLSNESRRDIWLKFFEKLETDQENLSDNDTRVVVHGSVQNYIMTDPHLQALEMNGRDIRNAFHASIKMAINRAALLKVPPKKIKLEAQDVRCVIENKYAFRQFLENVHIGKSEEQRAFDQGLRWSETDH